ncbi:MAG: VWA domain-containing protein [Christensenellaceae bacterium]|jgi:hypothetical protein|nr:VWA domain-containing protein [Christensenellaceae bacterium]
MANALTTFNGGNLKIAKPNALDLVLVIDRSGSMAGTEKGIIEGNKELVRLLKSKGRKITLTVILFDSNNSISVVFDGEKVEKVDRLKYSAEGATAFYDAAGFAIEHENKRKEDGKNPYPDADVLYVFKTDGEENDSVKYDLLGVQNLMLDERKKSYDGHGYRDFVFIREFGLEEEQFYDQMMIENNNTQIFFRGEKGLKVAFQTINVAANNMIEDGRITKKFKQQSDALPIGGKLTLGELKKITKESGKLFKNNEAQLMTLEKLAKGGYSQNFMAMYQICAGSLKNISNDISDVGDPEIDEILDKYVGKHGNVIGQSMKTATDVTISTLAQRNINALGRLSSMSEDKSAKADKFAEPLYEFKNNTKKLENVPPAHARLNGADATDQELEMRIKVLAAEQGQKYDTVIDNAFNYRTKLLKDARDIGHEQRFWQLGEFAEHELISTLLQNYPSYQKFCTTFNYLKRKMPERNERDIS